MSRGDLYAFWDPSMGSFSDYVRQLEEDVQPKDLSAAKLLTFTVDQRYEFNAPAAKVFAALTTQIGEWWITKFLREGARDIRLDAVAGGLMRQPLAHGGVFVMATVQEVVPDQRLVLLGAFGIPGAVYGRVSYTLESPAPGRTSLLIDHHVVGDLSPQTQTAFVEGWPLLLDGALRAFVERGEAQGVRAA